MLAYKTKLDVDKGILKIQLPEDFNGKQVEIIVLELTNSTSIEKKQNNNTTVLENSNGTDEPNEFQKTLMTAPTWSEEEYNNYLENRKIFSQWKII